MGDSNKISPEELQLITALINSARLQGITEISYKDLKVRFSPNAQAGEAGPVNFQRTQVAPSNSMTWNSNIALPKE
jgi:hypothetical protein